MERPFAAMAAVCALATANGLAPSRVRLPGISPFATSVAVSELAPWLLAGQVTAATSMVRKGALAGPLGRAALGVNVATGFGLAHMARTSVRSVELFTDELERAGLNADLPTPRWAPRPWRPVTGIRRTRDVPYSLDGTREDPNVKSERLLDIYEPTARSKRLSRSPAILFVHGGSWASGDKAQQGIPLLHHLAQQGWVGFNVNYRLSPAADLDDQIHDIKTALAFIRTNAARFQIDPDRIAVSGGSAGGHLAALLAVTANQPRYQGGFEDIDTSAAAAVPLYGVFDLTNAAGDFGPSFVPYMERVVVQARVEDEPDRFHRLSPLHLLDAASAGSGNAAATPCEASGSIPPFLVIHGGNDTVVAANESRRMVTALRKHSNATVAHVELPGAQHAYDVIRSARTHATISAIESFLNQTMALPTPELDD